MEPSEEYYEELDTYECLMATDTNKDLVVPTNPTIVNALLEDDKMAPAQISILTPSEGILQSPFMATRYTYPTSLTHQGLDSDLMVISSVAWF